ncbi:MAG: choice-of-anchor tandem repeat NxxGxxAF-containing protein [Planctomycetota bacterium]
MRGSEKKAAAALALAGLTAGVAGSTALATAFDVLMYSGQEITIPGRPDLPTLRVRQVLPPSQIGFQGGPALNNAGQLAFTARMADAAATGGQTIGDAVFHLDSASATPSLVALANDPVPGQAVGVTYDQILGRRLILDDAGRLAFGAQWERAGTFAVDPAIQVYTPANLPDAGVRIVARDSTTDPLIHPDNDPLSPVFGYELTSLNGAVVTPYVSRFVFNDNRVAFGAGFNAPSGTIGTFSGLYREVNRGGDGPNTNSSLRLMARNGTGSSFIPAPEVTALNNNALSAFRTSIQPNPNEGFFSALVTFFNDVSIEVQTGSDAGGDISFSGLTTRFGFNNSNQSAFRAGFTDLPDSDGGIFKTLDPQGIIASNGIVAAGTPDLGGAQGLGIPDGVPDFVFRNLQSGFAPLLNDAGDVVFEAIARTPDNTQSVRGLWSSRTGTLTGLDPIALVGDQAPGLPDGYTIFDFGLNAGTDQNVALNNNGDIAFLGTYESPTGQRGAALWAEHNGELKLIAADDFTQINLPDGSSFIAQGFGFFGGSGNEDGRPSSWSDNGTLAFRVDGQGSFSGAFVLADVAAMDFRGLPGDFNGNGQVEQGDLNLVLTNWGVNTVVNSNAVIPGGWKNYAENTGVIDQNELNLVLSNWGSTAAPSFEGFENVPEPAAALALLVFVGVHRRPVRVSSLTCNGCYLD